MIQLARNLPIALCSLSALASAQVVDADSSSPSLAVRAAGPPPPARAVHSAGSTKAILVPFNPYVTQTGVGSGGADVSELYTTFTLGAAGYNIFGYGMQGSVNNHVVDDFTVPAAQNWTVSDIKWLCYQTGAPTTGTITSMHLNL